MIHNLIILVLYGGLFYCFYLTARELFFPDPKRWDDDTEGSE